MYCICGEEFTESRTSTHLVLYCQSCGHEQQEALTSRKTPDNVVSINRASILKQIKNKVEEEPKKPKQIRDRTDYNKSRRFR